MGRTSRQQRGASDLKEYLLARHALYHVRDDCQEAKLAAASARDHKAQLHTMIEACPGEACRLPWGAVVRLKNHGSAQALNTDRMRLAMSMLSRDDLIAEGAVDAVVRTIAHARNVPGKAIHIFDDPGRAYEQKHQVISSSACKVDS